MGTTTARTKCTVCYPYKPEQNFHLISFLTTRILQVLGQPCRPPPFISNDRYQMWRTKANTCFFWDVTTPSYQISSQGKVRHWGKRNLPSRARRFPRLVCVTLIDWQMRERIPPTQREWSIFAPFATRWWLWHHQDSNSPSPNDDGVNNVVRSTLQYMKIWVCVYGNDLGWDFIPLLFATLAS